MKKFELNNPIRFDRDARSETEKTRTLLIYMSAARFAFNLSGIYPMPPLGVACLAAHLRKCGYYGSAILDMPAFGLSSQNILPMLQKNAFEIYGLSATLPGLPEAAAASRLIKSEINPEAIVVLGGPATRFSHEVIFDRLPYVDIIVCGAGEKPLEEIVRRTKEGVPLAGIPGTAWRENGGKKADCVPPEPEETFYEVLPARDLLPMERYKLHPPFGVFPPATTVETQRGCSYGCGFCSLPRSVSTRKVEDVILELEALRSQGYREIYFIDPTFPLDRNRTALLCEAMISAGLKLKWACKSRADTVDAELLNLMARAGCYMISYGIESGSERILQALNKRMSSELIRNTLRETRKAGIRPLCYILIGSPGETMETVRETARLLVEERASFALFGELLPDPGAPIFMNNPAEQEKIKDAVLRYYFDSDSSGLDGLNIAGVPRGVVQKWLQWINRAFYFRVSYIAGKLLEMKNPREFMNLATGFFHLVAEAWRVKREK
ncbi:MAG: radical SAM protein [bacterium]